jgi:hypothetical protein
MEGRITTNSFGTSAVHDFLTVMALPSKRQLSAGQQMVGFLSPENTDFVALAGSCKKMRLMVVSYCAPNTSGTAKLFPVIVLRVSNRI